MRPHCGSTKEILLRIVGDFPVKFRAFGIQFRQAFF